MILRSKWLGYLLAMYLILSSSIDMLSNTYAQGPEVSLDWSIGTSKQTFYPGEPVLLTLNIHNTGQVEEKVNFGADGIEAFSMEIHDRSNKIVRKGGKIERFGISSRGPLEVSPGEIRPKSIVLNQWCSTLLPAGQYHIICNVEYRLRSESRWDPSRQLFKAGLFHTIKLELDINVVEMDSSEFKNILEGLSEKAFKTKLKTKREFADRRIAREMLTFTELDLAVSYQLEVLRVEPSTWLKWDVINSLVRSGTLEAANGLMQIISENEDCPGCIEDVKREVIDAVYRLRETARPDIINATDGFVSRYKRPVLTKSKG